MYSSTSTTHTYNFLLNGRWHTGITPDICGQLNIEQLIIKLSGMNSSSHVLDFGCGNGLVSCDYNILTRASVHGITNQPTQIKDARKLAKSLNLDNVTFEVIEDESQLPYEASTYDIITFTESSCHIKNKIALFTEFKRILKPHGVIVGEDWCHLYPHIKYGQASKINRIYKTYLVKPDDYTNIGNMLNMNTELQVIKPRWKLSLYEAMKSRLTSLCYQYAYPKLPLYCPFPIDHDKINIKLIKAGKYLQRDEGFRLCIIVFKP
jgi:SAM-dependent methyltransferase